MNKKPRIFDSLLIVTFIVGLFLPLLLTHNGAVSPIEKRKLTPFPEFKWERSIFVKYPSQFEAFFNDHFGFRDHLSQLYSIFSVILQSSPNPNILIGKNDWLFYIKPKNGATVEYYGKNDPLTSKELSAWKTVLETKYDWLKQRGIQYLFVVAPDKQSIYGENFPSRIIQAGKQSRFDQLLEFMHDSEVPILDLRPPLLEAKVKGLLYYKTDSHWNDFGAAVAQYSILQYLSKYNPTLYPNDFCVEAFSWTEGKGRDLAVMLNLSSLMKEIIPILRNPLPLCNKRVIDERTDKTVPATFITECRIDAPKALIFRDSFFDALQAYISQYFSKSIFVWMWPDSNLLKQYVERYQPDIVIEERVERSL